MFEALGGRKLVAATLTIAVGIIMAIKGGDVPPNLLHLLEVIFGGYSLANVVNTVGTINRAVKVEEAAPAEEAVKVEEASTYVAPQPVGVPVQDAVEAFNAVRTDLATSHQLLAQTLDNVMKSVELSQKTLAALVDRVVK